MRLITTILLVIVCLTAMGQSNAPRLSGNLFSKKKEKSPVRLTYFPSTYLDTEKLYTTSTGVSVIVQNSLPKGRSYTDVNGERFGLAMYWVRVINQTDSPLELTMSFPGEMLGGESYLKVLLPPDTMTIEKESSYDYGATELDAFIATNVGQPNILQRMINPKGESMFYIGVLLHGENFKKAGLVLKEEGLFYRIDNLEIPCGQIVLKE